MTTSSPDSTALDPVLLDSTAAVVRLSRMSLAFGRVDRLTRHEDGVRLESDTDHTVMLGLVACAFAERHLPDLDLGLVAQYALVHDLVEVYAGDTPTLRALSADAKRDKDDREAAALDRIAVETSALPWVARSIRDYEHRVAPEARFVKAMDKMLPKITHVLNGCRVPVDEGLTAHELSERYEEQLVELRTYAADFPPLFELRRALLEMVLGQMSRGAAAS